MDGSSVAEPRIVCVGSNLESLVALTALLDERAQVVAVVTRPAGDRGAVCDYSDLHDLCRAAGIATIDTTDINAAGTLSAIRAARPDYVYTLGWSQLFSEELLSIPSRYVVGSHPSPLPTGRGRAPIPWTILQDVRRSAVTLFRMDRRADAGGVLVQEWFDVPADAYAEDVYREAAAALGRAFVALHRAHRSGRPPAPIPQSQAQASYRARRTPADGHLDFHRPADELVRLVRAVSRPYPGAYTYYVDQPRIEQVVIWRATTDDVPPYMGTPGQILLRRGERLLVQAGDGPFWCWDLSIDGQAAVARKFRSGAKFGLPIEDELASLRRQVAELTAIVEQLQEREQAGNDLAWSAA